MISVGYSNHRHDDQRIIFAYWTKLGTQTFGRIQLSKDGDKSNKPFLADVDYATVPARILAASKGKMSSDKLSSAAKGIYIELMGSGGNSGSPSVPKLDRQAPIHKRKRVTDDTPAKRPKTVQFSKAEQMALIDMLDDKARDPTTQQIIDIGLALSYQHPQKRISNAKLLLAARTWAAEDDAKTASRWPKLALFLLPPDRTASEETDVSSGTSRKEPSPSPPMRTLEEQRRYHRELSAEAEKIIADIQALIAGYKALG